MGRRHARWQHPDWLSGTHNVILLHFSLDIFGRNILDPKMYRAKITRVRYLNETQKYQEEAVA